MWRARIVQAALVAAGLAPGRLAGAQEIQLTGPLCGAPAAVGREPLRPGLELTATPGAATEVGGATHDAIPVLGFETRLAVDPSSRIRMGPALGITSAFGAGPAKRQLSSDAGWMFVLPMLRVLELSATAGATGLTLGRAGAASLGFHAGGAIEIAAPWRKPASHAIVGVGFDVRTFEREPTMLGLTLRLGAGIERPVTCEPSYWE